MAAFYPDVTFPRVVNSVTGTVVDASDLEERSMEGAYQDGRFTRDVGFVMRVFSEGTSQYEQQLEQVDAKGRQLALQLMEDFLVPTFGSDRHNTLELTYHTQCGPMHRYFLHYDENLSMAMLDRLLNNSDLPAQAGFRITFVPRTTLTDLMLGRNVLVNAGTRL